MKNASIAGIIFSLIMLSTLAIAQEDFLILLKDPKTLLQKSYEERNAEFSKLVSNPSVALDDYREGLRAHFTGRKKPGSQGAAVFVADNFKIVQKYFKDIETTKKPITNPTDLELLQAYLSSDQKLGSQYTKSVSLDPKIPVVYTSDDQNNPKSLSIFENGKEKIAVSLSGLSLFDPEEKTRGIKTTSEGLEFIEDISNKNSKTVTITSGSVDLIKVSSSSKYPIDEQTFGFVLKDANAQIKMSGTGGPTYFADEVTPGPAAWAVAQTSGTSEATITPGQASFSGNGYSYIMTRTRLSKGGNSDVYLSPPISGGVIAWGSQPAEFSLWAKTLGNPLEFVGNEGKITSFKGYGSPPLIGPDKLNSDTLEELSGGQIVFKNGKPYQTIGKLPDTMSTMTFTGSDGSKWGGSGCHYSALCNQCSVSVLTGAPNPKITGAGGAMERLAAARTVREAAEVRRSLPAQSGLIGEGEFQRMANMPGQDISLGQGRLFRDLKPTGERVFAELKNDPDLAATMKNPALRTKLENSYSSLLEPLTGWIKDNYKNVLIDSSKAENGYKAPFIGYKDLSAKVDVKVMEYKSMTLGLVVKVSPGPESKSQWQTQYIYLQNPDPGNKDLVKVIQKVQKAMAQR